MQNMILEALQLTLNNALDGSTALEAEIQNYPELLKVIQYVLYLHYLDANWIEQKEIYEFEHLPLSFLLLSLLPSPFLFHPFSFPSFRFLGSEHPWMVTP
jgi:hypothetical protein